MNSLGGLIGPKNSLRRGVLVNVIIALCLCVLIAGVILIKEFYEHLEESLDATLLREATEIAGQLDPDLENYGLPLNALRFQGPSGVYRYTVFDISGNAIIGSETSERIQAQLHQLLPEQHKWIELPGARVGIALKTQTLGQDAVVLVSTNATGTDGAPLQDILHEISEELGWVVLGVFVVMASALLATRRALAPINKLSTQAEAVGPSSTHQRLETDQVPTEIVPLIREVNSAFDRLEQGYQAQRDFSSNVAHEVRTPIAVLKSTVERIADPDLKKTLGQDVSRLDQMFSQLIDLSRADAALKSSFVDIDLRALAVEAAGEMAQMALKQRRSLSLSGAENASVLGNPGLLKIAMTNLIRNAVAYAPEGSEIEVEIFSDPPGWRVLDRGAGVPDDLKPQLFERFNRGAQTNSNSAGSGIGLAIVQSVAKSHGASVGIEDREGGGSAFTFVFQQT